MSTQEETLTIERMPLTEEQGRWVQRAWELVDRDGSQHFEDLLMEMVNIPSPTGEERRLAEYLVAYMRGNGFESFYQPIDEQQGNAVGRLRGDRSGPDLLLYAPVDTHVSGDAEEDEEGLGDDDSPYVRCEARKEDGFIVGLGAENPKGYAAALVVAADIVRRAGVPLRGSVLVGLGSGGMPTNKRPRLTRYNTGQGTGCAYMLQQGVRGDFALIAKLGWALAWEEVALSYFKVRVKGEFGYAGTRHVLPYRNPIVAACKVVEYLEAWFPQYAERNTSGLVAPQGIVGAIRGGFTYKPTFIPAVCDIYCDVRVSPLTDPMEVKRQFEDALAEFQRQHPEIQLESKMILAVPAGRTDPRNWIVQSALRAHEAIDGKAPVPPAGSLNMVMSRCSVRAMRQYIKSLIYVIVDTCTRTRAEVGLTG